MTSIVTNLITTQLSASSCTEAGKRRLSALNRILGQKPHFEYMLEKVGLHETVVLAAQRGAAVAITEIDEACRKADIRGPALSEFKLQLQDIWSRLARS